MEQKTALLLGGTGLIGRHCLDYLLNDDHYRKVLMLVRRPVPVSHPKLVQQQVDFSQLANCLNDTQIDDVYCCLGTTIKKAGSRKAFYEVDFTYPVEMAKLSIANGAKQFLLVSALGANPNSPVFYNRVKGEVEQELGLCGFKGLYIFRPSLLLGKRSERRLAEEYGQKLFRAGSFAFKGPLKKYRPIKGKAVAFAMLAMAKQQKFGNTTVNSRQIQAIYDDKG
jgi:uncharacterized protein YbjT (DUF2867 family)